MAKMSISKRVIEIESENFTLRARNECLREMIMQFAEKLNAHGVKVEIVLPEPEMIELEDPISGVMYRMPGRQDNGGEIELRFDFTEHDAKVMKSEV